jgi:hypothetical protein
MLIERTAAQKESVALWSDAIFRGESRNYSLSGVEGFFNRMPATNAAVAASSHSAR